MRARITRGVPATSPFRRPLRAGDRTDSGHSSGFRDPFPYRRLTGVPAWQNPPRRAIGVFRGQGVMDFVPGGELSRRIRDGDVTAETELIRQFEPGLRVLLRRRTGGDHRLLQDL